MSGPRLWAAVTAAIAVMVVALALTVEAPASAVVRWTARTSLTLFVLTYVARPATQLAPSPLSRGLLARRKWLGLGFASSQAFHLGGILALGWPDLAGFFASRPPNPVGVASFVAVAAMTITSFDRIKRATPRRAWKLIHGAGMHIAWLVFAVTYGGRVADHPIWAAPLAVLIAAAGVRGAAWVRGRRRAAARPTA